ncbi:MAG TPA: hypothetical protein VF499_06815 [Afipia sp.]
MPDDQLKKVTREYRIVITVEEIEAPKLDNASAAEQSDWGTEVEEFLDEGDYSKGG